MLIKVNKDFEEEWHQIFGQPRGYNANYIHHESYGVKELPGGNNAAEYVNQTDDCGFVIFTDSDTVGVMKQHNFGLMKLRSER